MLLPHRWLQPQEEGGNNLFKWFLITNSGTTVRSLDGCLVFYHIRCNFFPHWFSCFSTKLTCWDEFGECAETCLMTVAVCLSCQPKFNHQAFHAACNVLTLAER